MLYVEKLIVKQKQIPNEVFYINLDRNKNRAKHMESLLDFVGIKNRRRFPGVDSKEIFKNSTYLKSFIQFNNVKFNYQKQKKNAAFSIKLKGDAPITHRTGNWLSFLFLFKEIASLLSDHWFLVLEDDIDLEFNFVDMLINSIKKAPKDWEILLCGYENMGSKKKKQLSPLSKKVWIATEYFVCLHCFILRNSKIATIVANKLDFPVFTSATDHAISGLIKTENLQVYALIHQLSLQRRDIFDSNAKDYNYANYMPKNKLLISSIDLMRMKNISA